MHVNDIVSELNNVDFNVSLVAKDGKIVRTHLPLLVSSGVSWTKCLVDQPPPCCGDMFVLLPEIDSVLLKSFVDNLYSVTSSSDEDEPSSSDEDEPEFHGFSKSDIPSRPVTSSIEAVKKDINNM